MPPNGICVVVGPLERAWFFSLTGVRENTPLKLENFTYRKLSSRFRDTPFA